MSAFTYLSKSLSQWRFSKGAMATAVRTNALAAMTAATQADLSSVHCFFSVTSCFLIPFVKMKYMLMNVVVNTIGGKVQKARV